MSATHMIVWCNECDKYFGAPIENGDRKAALEVANRMTWQHFLIAHPEHPDVPGYQALLES